MNRPDALTDEVTLGLMIAAILFLTVWFLAATFMRWYRRFDAPRRRR